MVFMVKPKQEVPAALVRDGTYKANLTSIQKFANTYGERVGFEFTVLDGRHQGEKVIRSTAPQLTRQSKLTEVIEGILGRPLTEHELTGGIDLDQLIGKECSILVLQSRSKTGVTYSNVERVFST